MLKVGIAVADMTPPAGVRLRGFSARTKGALAVHDPLSARAVAFDDGKNRFCVVALDATSLDATIADEIKSRIRKRRKINPNLVALLASHSHAAPELWLPGHPPGAKPIEIEYTRSFLDTVAGAVSTAIGNLKPARLGAESGWCAVGCNRRELTRTGNIVLGQDPFKPIDTELGIIRIDDTRGRAKCVMTNYGCHGVSLMSDNLLISADWLGYARYHIERAVGRGVTAVTTQGCAGNVNPRRLQEFSAGKNWVKGSFFFSDNIGSTLAREAVRVAGEIKTSRKLDVQAHSKIVELPRDKKAQLAYKREKLRAMKRSKRPKGKYDSPYTFGDPRVRYHPDRLKKEISRFSRDRSKTIPAEVQVFSVGDIAFVTWPGEIFAQHGMALKQRSPFRKTYVLGYANGRIGYVPTAAAWPEGGYEVGCALDRGLARGAGEILVDKSVRLLEAIWKKRS